MGTISDHCEHLGHTDLAIVMFRRLMLRLADQLGAASPPKLISKPDAFAAGSASAVLSNDASYEESVADLAAGAVS